jgi:hypothetical protein
MPEEAASRLTSWQQLGMVILIEIIIVIAFVIFEVLGEEPQSKIALRLAKRDSELEIEPGPDMRNRITAFAPPPKPKLIASSAEPYGSVPAIMAGVMEPGNARDKAELADLYKAYSQVCRLQGKRPLPPQEFSDALQRLCTELGIRVSHKGEHVYLMKVRLKNVVASAG